MSAAVTGWRGDDAVRKHVQWDNGASVVVSAANGLTGRDGTGAVAVTIQVRLVNGFLAFFVVASLVESLGIPVVPSSTVVACEVSVTVSVAEEQVANNDAARSRSSRRSIEVPTTWLGGVRQK